MPNKNVILRVAILLFLCNALSSYAQTRVIASSDGLSQTLQIYTRFSSFVGKPSWLLIIRDVDHNQNVPYVFDITQGNHFWIAFTYGRNYLISVSTLQIETYKSRLNKYKQYRINNFCQLESQGRIIKGKSIYITISGDLSPDPSTYTCYVSQYDDGDFTIVNPNATN